MSLLTEQLDPCTLLNKQTQADGYGGYLSTWTEGAQFSAAIVFESSVQARVAAAQGVTNLYTITTGREMNLQFHDVFRRESDGKIFRVTSDGDDKKTPPSATLNMRQVTGEEWELPRG